MKKKFNPGIFKWLIIILTIHIFSVMAGLLHNLNGRNEALWLAFVFAASYAVASGFIVFLANQRWLIFCYAISDGMGVGFYYFSGTPGWLIAIYFALYTAGLIASTIYLTSDPVADIVAMKRSGRTVKDIAAENGTSEYKIAKLIRENEN